MSFSEEIKNEILNSIEKNTKKLDKIKYESFGEMLTQTNKKRTYVQQSLARQARLGQEQRWSLG